MQRRFVVQFLFQICFLSILLFISLAALIIGIGYYVSDSQIYHDLHEADDLFYETVINYDGEDWQLKPKFEKTLMEQGGWLIVYDEDGYVLYEKNVPENEPTHYEMMLHDVETVERSFKKVEPLNGDPFIVSYSSYKTTVKTLQQFQSQLDWSKNLLPTLQTEAIVYLFNANGDVLDSINPISKTLNLEDIMDIQNSVKYETAAFTDKTTGKTVMIASEQMILDDTAFILNMKKPFFIGISILILLLVLTTLFYAKKFGSPLLIMMKWIGQLNDKNYDMPLNKHGHRLLVNKKGKLKRKYKLYKELFETLEGVTKMLKKNEEQQQLVEKTREEWITSLSHDLKTPLSSISGYIKMLQSDYDWSKYEQQQFYKTIDEKSDYMMSLIEDLTLTYRLKNEQLPLCKQLFDVNEVVRRTVIQLINNQQFNDYSFDLLATDCQQIVELDLKWFQRILDNLLMNAIKHNPSGTAIIVGVGHTEQNVAISIRDNGVGMDEKTIDHLFNRYYRGTNTTESIEGTGLGMAITKQLILLQGGAIDINSEEKIGTEIIVTFPKVLTKELA